MVAKNSSNLYHVVEKQGGIVLSEYLGTDKPIKIQCNCGYIWNPMAGNIKRGSWCPKCANKEPQTLQDCQKWANRQNGECLNSEYINAHFMMTWKCHKNHIWKASWNNVKGKNSWCPDCQGDKKESTFLKNYGVKNPLQNKDIRDKVRATMIERYGVPYSLQNKEIALKNARSRNDSYIENHWETGEELVCIGSYEQKVIQYLNKNRIAYKWQPETFKLSNGKTYRPDLYLIAEDKWIEIKGWLTDLAKEKWELFLTIKPNSCMWLRQELKNMGIL